jgi:hypothetical protein
MKVQNPRRKSVAIGQWVLLWLRSTDDTAGPDQSEVGRGASSRRLRWLGSSSNQRMS